MASIIRVDTNSALRGELLNREIFTTLMEAKVLIEEWRREYNQVKLHSVLGYPATCSRGYKANSNAGNSNLTSGTTYGGRSEES